VLTLLVKESEKACSSIAFQPLLATFLERLNHEDYLGEVKPKHSIYLISTVMLLFTSEENVSLLYTK
jgi:hypothetical protein